MPLVCSSRCVGIVRASRSILFVLSARSISPIVSRQHHFASYRQFSTSRASFKSSEIPFKDLSEEQQELLTEERAVDNVDVCIVGGGPSGLATAIRLKQLDKDDELRVVVLEKGPEIGSHILSGAVLEPRALKELFPESEYYDEDGKGIPLPPDMVTMVKEEHMKLLMGNGLTAPLPEPPMMANKGRNYIASLSEVTGWLGEQAEAAGVEVYPNTSVSSLVYDSEGAVKGVATKDVGIGKDGTPNEDDFERGLEFHAKLTVLAEGCRGSLSKQAIKRYSLTEGRSKQTYGIGVKEVWEVKPENFKKGYIAHSMGYPLDKDTYGGGFQYHFGDGLVTVGLVVGLDYKDPWISPYQEFQKMKMHPFYKKVLEGGKCISYGARALNEGGLQAVPKLHFPGGVLVGASAGFMNVPKIKGSHTAIKSGILAAEVMYPEVLKVKSWVDEELSKNEEKVEEEEKDEDDEDEDEMIVLPEWKALDLEAFQSAYEKSWIKEELHVVRNVRPSFHNPLGLWGGMVMSGLVTLITRGYEPFTLGLGKSDPEAVEDASKFKQRDYPKPDGKITFDILTSVSRTGTYHKENERCHLRVPEQDLEKHAELSYPRFKGIEQRFCPAGVYEYVPDPNSKLGVKFQINSQNCIHCKTCDIKVPTEDIDWSVPEGGDGPKYQMT
ncbi:DEKNAAC103502 [Brettanomyces naardenensis]|uniref:Electron transfer flavoprotein-ubiquinone oxidoreductase n=1 Tax=Brettanomyces naardenensis TaxID=13370 RepID=A0A448YNY7_BRENA|nr:DEKNAAC103502 [Brettanomyces naardenensis]